MQFKHFGLLLVGVAAASAGGKRGGQSNTSAEAIRAENAFALQDCDCAALGCILDPAFTENDRRGQQVSSEAVRADFSRRPPSIVHLFDLKATIEGSVAVVAGLNRLPDEKIVAAIRFADIFVHRGHRWRAVGAEETLVRPAQ